MCGLPLQFMFAVGNLSVLSNRFVLKSLSPYIPVLRAQRLNLQNIIASHWSGTRFYDKLVKNIYFYQDEDFFLLALVVTQDIATK